jgi:single-strand DNA-binding protein
MNKLIIIGNLTKDPETRVIQSGKSVCSFDVAVNERRGGQDNTTYFRVSAWEKIGESCQRYLSRGKKVMVAGPVSARAYTKSDGSVAASLEINAHEIEFLSPAGQEGQPVPKAPTPQAPTYTPVETEELPF